MEHWHETYTSDVDVYEAFATACDPEGLVWHRVLETIPFADKIVLEIGYGLGHYARAIVPTTMSYTALDVSETMLAAARQRGPGTANLNFFPSLPEAERVLGFMFEEKARQYLRQHPSPRLGHGAIFVRKTVAGA